MKEILEIVVSSREDTNNFKRIVIALLKMQTQRPMKEWIYNHVIQNMERGLNLENYYTPLLGQRSQLCSLCEIAKLPSRM